MLSYCLKCKKKTKKKTENKNPKVVKPENGRIILFSKLAVCDSKKKQDLSMSKKLVYC